MTSFVPATPIASQGEGWAFELFAKIGQRLGPNEIAALPTLAANVTANDALLRAAVTPATPLTGIFAAGTYPEPYPVTIPAFDQKETIR